VNGEEIDVQGEVSKADAPQVAATVELRETGSRLSPLASRLAIRHLGVSDYEPTFNAMRSFTDARTSDTPDEIWLLEHRPVYTYGVAGRAEHLPSVDTVIPVIKVDRGGQVTYHGPGQLVAYALIDLRRRDLTVRSLVRSLEQATLDLLAELGVRGERSAGAPGVYVAGAKVAALGLRIRNGCSYHGLSLNVNMDLTPFNAIDPCGYPGLRVTQLSDLGIHAPISHVAERLVCHLVRELEQ
jgi:lipoyl(octanoyl) transferase